MAKIDVISSCLVKMAADSHPDAIRGTLELTPWDLQFLLRDSIQKGILFYKPNSSGKLASSTSIIDHLKNSLSRVLAFFPPLSGRLSTIKHDNNTTSFFVDCNDAGAEFTHAVVGAVSVSDILKPNYMPAILSSFFPLTDLQNDRGVSTPLLRVQVTELADGIFIGCTANHVLVDGASFWHFFHSWSEISCGSDTLSKPPIFDRWFPSNISDKNRLICLPLLDHNLSDEYVPPPLLERVFHFSQDSLAELKAKANFEGSSNRISILQALSAHLWRIVVRSRHKQTTNIKTSKQEVPLVLPVGARARIPLQEGYFGNAVCAAKTTINEHELMQNGLGFAALKINEFVTRQTGEAMIRFVEDWVETPVLIPRRGMSNFVVSSSPRFNVYGCDFGWGKPVAVRSGRAQKYDGKMTFYPAAEPGGIDVEVCLAPETMQAMEDDAELVHGTAQI